MVAWPEDMSHANHVDRRHTQTQEQYELLSDILDTISEVNPMLREIIRDQGNWDLDRLEERGITDVIIGFRDPYTRVADTQPLQEKIDLLRRYGEDVLANARV